MPMIRKFRIDNDDPSKERMYFYVKVNGEDDKALLNLCVAGDGIYYYKPGSQILSPKENHKTRDTYDGYLPMSTMKDIFEKLRGIGWTRRAEENEEIRVVVSRDRNRLILELEEGSPK